jgi:DNA-directed RNA polymerase specialized sigma24 family protein
MEWDGFHALVQRACSGDRAARDEVLLRVRPYLMKLVTRYLGPEWQNNSFADLGQKACLRVWEKLPTFHGGANDQETAPAFRKWAARLVRNVIDNHWRAKLRPMRHPEGGVRSLDQATTDSAQGPAAALADQGPSASKHLRDEERDSLIARALSTLEPVDRVRKGDASQIIRIGKFVLFEIRLFPPPARSRSPRPADRQAFDELALGMEMALILSNPADAVLLMGSAQRPLTSIVNKPLYATPAGFDLGLWSEAAAFVMLAPSGKSTA